MNKAIVVVLAAALLAGCESMGQKEGMGAVIGGAAGGLLGSQFGKGSGKAAMTALGAVGGLLVGSSIGRTMDEVDRMRHERTAADALEHNPAGQPSSWRNPDTGYAGSVTPTRTYQRSDGTYCREFTQTITVGGRAEDARGTACRQPDGTWKIIG